jgi:hypothetical protein
MLKKLIKPLAATIMAAATALPAWATPSVDEMVDRVNRVAYYSGADGRAQVRMLIIDDQGRRRQRSFTILRKDMPESDALEDRAYLGEQKFYVYFNRPADVNKMVFMVHKKLEGDDDRWLYLPALDLVKRIAGSDKRTSFVGSDYFYEDVSGRSIDADTHELLEETDAHYVLKHTPKDAKAVEFDHYIMYVNKQNFVPEKTEYFDKAGTKYRISKAVEVKDINGYPTVIKGSMENLRTGSKTLMRYGKVEYDIDIPEDIFTERYLRNAPQKYLR